MAEMLEDRIREHAYHLWEASGRPVGHDEEFWHQACELVAADGNQSPSTSERLQPKRAQSPQPPRKRGRTSRPATPEVSAPVGSL